MKEVDVGTILELRTFKCKIAEIMNISQTTLYRRLEEAGVATDDRTNLSDTELDAVISSIKQDHQNDGEVLIRGHLIRMQIGVPRQAIRNSIHRVDHANVASRRRTVVRRRAYICSAPSKFTLAHQWTP